MNHSCNPNCATQKWIVNGELRVGLFATKAIAADTELTFDYKYVRYGASAQRCLCGEPNCKGIIGIQKQDVTVSDYEFEPSYDADFSLTSERDIEKMLTLLLRTEEQSKMNLLLTYLYKVEDPELWRHFLEHHGLHILSIILCLYPRENDTLLLTIKIIDKLPIHSRNLIQTIDIEEKLEKILSMETSSAEVKKLCERILGRWRKLQMIYTIPKINTEKESSAGKKSSSSGYSLMETDRQFVAKRSKWLTESNALKIHEKTNRDFLASNLPSYREQSKGRTTKTFESKVEDRSDRLTDLIQQSRNRAITRDLERSKNDLKKEITQTKPTQPLQESIFKLICRYTERACKPELSPEVISESAKKIYNEVTSKETYMSSNETSNEAITSMKKAKIKAYVMKYLSFHGLLHKDYRIKN